MYKALPQGLPYRKIPRRVLRRRPHLLPALEPQNQRSRLRRILRQPEHRQSNPTKTTRAAQSAAKPLLHLPRELPPQVLLQGGRRKAGQCPLFLSSHTRKRRCEFFPKVRNGDSRPSLARSTADK